MSIPEWLRIKKGVLHFTLIDPDRQSPERLAGIVRTCRQFGTDAIMVGGSSSFSQRLLDETMKTIKRNVDLPTILFPNSAAAVSRHADYIFFMSLLNSLDSRFLIKEQALAAAAVKRARLCPISMAYIVVSTSREPTSIEKRVRLDTIGIQDAKRVKDYALAAEYLGMSCVYLEAGSGADRPVPLRMIRSVRSEISVPLIVGGGIREPRQAGRIAEAGADVIVTGTIVEQDISRLEAIIKAIKQPRSEKR